MLGYHHFGTDVLAGAFIGWVMAFFGYRMVFRGVRDWECNAVPLLRLRDEGTDGIGIEGPESSHGHGPMVDDLEVGLVSR